MLPAPQSFTDASRQPGSRPGGPPRVVAIGGGTGLPNVLRGLRPLLYTGGDRQKDSTPRDQLAIGRPRTELL